MHVKGDAPEQQQCDMSAMGPVHRALMLILRVVQLDRCIRCIGEYSCAAVLW